MIKPMQSVSSLFVGMVKDMATIPTCDVAALTMDSRDVTNDSVFLATAKVAAQRQEHIEQAIASGASVVAIDPLMPLIREVSVPVIAVSDLDRRLSEIASRFYRHPSLALTIIAVTGTNGKTSVSQFIAQALSHLSQPCGVIGTLGIGTLDDQVSSGMTTPDPVKIQAALADFYQRGIRTVVMEASSHALQQDRLRHIAIDIAVLTNISRDHLDYHGTMSAYQAAKQKLFEFDSVQTVVLNQQDDFGAQLLQQAANDPSLTCYSYGIDTRADVVATDCHANQEGMSFILRHREQYAPIQSHLFGHFNIANLLATAASLSALGYDFQQISQALGHCSAVEGRMQYYGGGEQVTIVIDFAHTPDALEHVLASLKEHLPPHAALWCVFGCGGDRDSGKRPLMGKAVADYADRCVVTSDNPRSEDNSVIVAAIVAGMANSKEVHIEHDRQQAIRYAVQHAQTNDIILVAGKGHEDYQEIQGVKHPYSDKAVVLSALQAANDGSLEKEVMS